MTDHNFIAPVHGSDNRPRAAQTPTLPTALSDYAPFEAPQDDDGQISCLCGFDEDDGNTVACDSCNRWQHIRCYYPQHANGELPEDLQHFCVDCQPRRYDTQAATVRQREARGQKDNFKRPNSKGQKKKPNGWQRDQTSSPKEGPPTKRPKTSHRSSNSTQLKRSTSATPELSRIYSSDFIRTYQQDEYTIPSTNCLTNLEIGARMREWLCNVDEVYRISRMSPPDLFQRYDQDISTIDQQMDLISVQEMSDNRFRLADGTSPIYKYAVLKEGLSAQACIGELRGHIGLKEDYEADPANKWNVLRHPAPFVFYHPHLPLCVDARAEGTVVRYVRRSCSPNAELRIIITDDSDYHFCFIATRDIEAGEEVAIAWDSARSLAETVSARSSDAFSRTDLESVQQWVSTVLYHCGPCACDRTDCWMARFDKRPEIDLADPIKPMKRKKKHHLSPLNTNAHSRSGSEVRKVEEDDSRSASISTGKESASRDITPNTTYTANGVPELSERERKKLAKEEEIFRRQEAEAQGKQMKKKRASGGVTKANSPAEKRRHTGVRQNGGRRAELSGTTTQTESKRTYVDSAVQCDMDADEAEQRRTALAVSRRPRMSMHRRIAERCAESNEIWATRRLAVHRVQLSSHDLQQSSREDAMTSVSPRSQETDSPVVPHEVAAIQQVKIESDHANPDLAQDAETFESSAFPRPMLNGDHTLVKTPLNGIHITSAVVQSPASLVPPENLLSPAAQNLNTPVRKKLSLSEYSKQRKAKESEAKNDREGEKDRDSSPPSFLSTPATSLESATEQINKELQSVSEDITMEDVPIAAEN